MHCSTAPNAGEALRVIGRRLLIFGRVQGVFYRNWATGEARALGLRGWIRNCGDGSVEAMAFGEAEAVDAFVARCRKGPPAAVVERIDVELAEGEAPDDFRTAPTA
jgi:acylphosphatase